MKRLKKWKIKLVHQYTVSRGEHKTGCYSIDIFLPDYKVALELDGYSHNGDEAKKHDAKRSEYLLNKGIRTVRVSNKDVADLTRKWLLPRLTP
jgi:very-short-patch-repair endonuclease